MKKLAVAVLGAVIVAGLAVLSFTVGSRHQNGNATTSAFDLPALEGGGRVQLVAYRGKPVIVTLFASWCAACQQELPEYARTAQSFRGRLQFIGVDAQETANGAAFAGQFHLAQVGFALAKDIDESSTGGLYKAYGAHGLPLTAFYSPSGTLLWKANAAVPPDIMSQKLQQYYGL